MGDFLTPNLTKAQRFFQRAQSGSLTQALRAVERGQAQFDELQAPTSEHWLENIYLLGSVLQAHARQPAWMDLLQRLFEINLPQYVLRAEQQRRLAQWFADFWQIPSHTIHAEIYHHCHAVQRLYPSSASLLLAEIQGAQQLASLDLAPTGTHRRTQIQAQIQALEPNGDTVSLSEIWARIRLLLPEQARSNLAVLLCELLPESPPPWPAELRQATLADLPFTTLEPLFFKLLGAWLQRLSSALQTGTRGWAHLLRGLSPLQISQLQAQQDWLQALHHVLSQNRDQNGDQAAYLMQWQETLAPYPAFAELHQLICFSLKPDKLPNEQAKNDQYSYLQLLFTGLIENGSQLTSPAMSSWESAYAQYFVSVWQNADISLTPLSLLKLISLVWAQMPTTSGPRLQRCCQWLEQFCFLLFLHASHPGFNPAALRYHSFGFYTLKGQHFYRLFQPLDERAFLSLLKMYQQVIRRLLNWHDCPKNRIEAIEFLLQLQHFRHSSDNENQEIAATLCDLSLGLSVMGYFPAYNRVYETQKAWLNAQGYPETQPLQTCPLPPLSPHPLGFHDPTPMPPKTTIDCGYPPSEGE